MKLRFLNLLTHTRYSLLNWDLMQHIGTSPYLVLLHLLERYEYLSTVRGQKVDWFYCLSKDIEERTLLSPPRQQRAIETLQEFKYIETKRRGMPAKLYFKVNLDEIQNFFTQKEQVDSFLETKKQVSMKSTNKFLRNKETVTNINTINNNTIKKENTNNIVEGSKRTSTDRNKNYIPIAELLAMIIQQKKNIKVDKRKLNTWSNSIRQLVERDGVESRRIRIALRWYKHHWGDDFVPVIESGQSLRDKFLRLESAIERSKSTPATSKTTGFQGKQTLKYKKSIPV
jgi:hypothetical protein